MARECPTATDHILRLQARVSGGAGHGAVPDVDMVGPGRGVVNPDNGVDLALKDPKVSLRFLNR